MNYELAAQEKSQAQFSSGVTKRKCDRCQEKEHTLQRSAVQSAPDSVPPIVLEILQSSGQPLDAHTRNQMESSFGQDFSQVRVHTDNKAAKSARAVNALAYTVGRHVVFGTSQYNPVSKAGRQLLGHELTHVIQQNNISSANEDEIRISPASNALEEEANNRAINVEDGRLVTVSGIAPFSLARTNGKEKMKCPSTHTIPDDIYKAVGEAWIKSRHGGTTVAEHGGRVVEEKGGKRAIRTVAGGRGKISLPAEKAGDVTLGTFHTHPSRLGVSFSGEDIANFIAGNQGSVKYVGAGSCNFALATLNPAAKDACKRVDVKKHWKDSFAAAAGSFQEKVEIAVKTAITGCGLCYYKVCRPNAKSPIPKVAKLL